MKLLHFNQDVVLKVTFKGYKMQGLFHLLFFFFFYRPSHLPGTHSNYVRKQNREVGESAKNFF